MNTLDQRLDVLMLKMEQEGRYVISNTVWLAIEEIKRLKIEVNEAAATTVYEILGHHRWGSDADRAKAREAKS